MPNGRDRDSLWDGPRGAGSRRKRTSPKKAVKRAAKKAARRGGKKVMKSTDAFVRGMIGRVKEPKERTSYRKVQDVVKAHGEEDAARRFGVTKRTLQHWIHPDRRKRRAPSKVNRLKIDEQHDTHRVREKMITRKRQAELKQIRENGMDVKIVGNIGPIDPNYQRIRQITHKLPPDAAQQVIDAFTRGGPDAAQDLLMRFLGSADPSSGYFGKSHGGDVPVHVSDIMDLQLTPRDTPPAHDDFDE